MPCRGIRSGRRASCRVLRTISPFPPLGSPVEGVLPDLSSNQLGWFRPLFQSIGSIFARLRSTNNLLLRAKIRMLRKKGVIRRLVWRVNFYDLGHVRKTTVAALSLASDHLQVVLEGQGLTAVQNTPHRAFVVGHVIGNDEMKQAWRRYITTYYGSAVLANKEPSFTAMIETAQSGGHLGPILIKIRREGESFVVVDGFHRLAINSVLAPSGFLDCDLTA